MKSSTYEPGLTFVIIILIMHFYSVFFHTFRCFYSLPCVYSGSFVKGCSFYFILNFQPEKVLSVFKRKFQTFSSRKFSREGPLTRGSKSSDLTWKLWNSIKAAVRRSQPDVPMWHEILSVYRQTTYKKAPWVLSRPLYQVKQFDHGNHGCAVAWWLVRSSLEQAVRVPVLAEDTVTCS